jgi:CBS domain-containing protein
MDSSDPGAFRVDVLINDTVVCVEPTAILRDVADVLIGNSIGAVVVGTQDSPAGIVSQHDIVRAVADGAAASTTAADIAHTRLFWCDASTTVAEVATQMMAQYVRHILVEENGRLAGIVSARDLLGVYAIGDNFAWRTSGDAEDSSAETAGD